MDIIRQLGGHGIIPVIKIEQAAQARKLGEAFLAGGLPCAEITFRTDAAEEAIHILATSQPELLVGAGTVLSVSQAQKAVSAGARFIVSPGFDARVVSWCQENSVPVVPGIATPSEAMQAVSMGISVLKFFPAEEMGGIPYLKAIAPVLSGVKFIPTGGISTANLVDYLRLPMVHAIGGSWLANARDISAGRFDVIEQTVREAVALVRQGRQS